MEWNTESIETMELEHVTSQAAQDLGDGETRHESRKAQAHEHEIYLNAKSAVDETREHHFIKKRRVSSTARHHEPRRDA